ncbi:hypothetical protein H4R20_002840 [Coemansia guatemalensis]|uniref:BD-FAE-like domain-containing protein n=1 Tax=Coemansia guatemalensis TaxID=2761395 RepID=A0A9W8I1R3_9FUNG|nr:hypothetical protein H4R20_002840 [Coemansia guatemalensis]
MMTIKIQVHEDIRYTNDGNREHWLDIYFPQICPAVLPLVVYVHGGAWRTGDKAEFSHIAEGLIGAANNRLAVAVVNYTLSTRTEDSIRHPGHLNDVIKAVKFLVTDQDYPGRSIVDTRRIFLVGHSAGAHMTALMALAPQPAFQYLGNIRGVVGVGGIYNIPKLLKTNPDYSDFIDMAFVKGQHQADSPHYAAKVMLAAASHVRFLVVNSAGDELVGSDQATDFASQLVETGYRDVTLIVRDLGTHEGTLGRRELWEIVVGFIFN